MEKNVQLLDNGLLEIVLGRFLKKEYPDSEKIIILDRVLNNYSSTFPTEIVTCQLSSGLKIKLFCKYINKEGHTSLWDGSDQDYESLIYQHVLSSININSPKYYGVFDDSRNKTNILFLGYLENAVRYSDKPSSIIEAVKWIANFHKLSMDKIDSKELFFVKKYNINYYYKWADRILEINSDQLNKMYPWLTQLCEKYKSNVHLLLNGQLSIIHGEYYPHNVLYSEEQIVPVDWESAAIADGVIDLASLTEGWNSDIVDECINKYSSIMYGKPEASQFIERFWLGQMYWCLRWISEKEDLTTFKNNRHFENLYKIGEKLELI